MGSAVLQSLRVEANVPANRAERTDIGHFVAIDREFQGARVACHEGQAGPIGDVITIPFAKYASQKKLAFAIAHFHPAVFRCADDNTRAAVRVAVDPRPVFILRRLSFGRVFWPTRRPASS